MNLNLFKYFRTKHWWNYIFPPILGVAYCGILLSGGVFMENWLRLLMFFLSFLFTASFGFFLNDMTDISEDTLVSKTNYSAKIKPIIRYFILATLLVFSIISWYFIKDSYPAIFFYFFQIILLILYSLKPFRLKRFIFPAIISDSLYSSLIPALIAIFLFYDKTQSLPSILICIIVMFFLRGLRNILIHQIIDKQNDTLAQTQTFIIKYGEDKVVKYLRRYFIPLELVLIVSVCIILIYLFDYAWIILPISFLFFAVKIFDAKAEKNKILKLQLINDFYEDILPLVFLVLLSICDIYFLILLFLHVIIFQNKVIWLILPWLYYKLFFNKYVKAMFKLLYRN